MGYYVGVQFSFPCNSAARLQAAAYQTLQEQSLSSADEDEDEMDSTYTQKMLKMIVANPDKYVQIGNKGDMFFWGGVWNYYTAEREIPYLKHFLLNCWLTEIPQSILFDFDQALLIINCEQSLQSEIYQFSLQNNCVVTVKQSVSELCWKQI